jgi:hypothetical protein
VQQTERDLQVVTGLVQEDPGLGPLPAELTGGGKQRAAGRSGLGEAGAERVDGRAVPLVGRSREARDAGAGAPAVLQSGGGIGGATS